ncbi:MULTISPECIES: aminoacyl-tRNA hydrolase [Helicobacter]|uniref:Peptidyl-tRNA hydrolase n=1 Tax=Helicobacter ibis TaxID=2962633 RepID=A0ABT4VDU2_9HELI|nr:MULTISPECIES: aminoacyl-tRNA hydrolase [Helicobacter]MDA3966512.1 aminoacyl-tRNA hydrolase [Helicobacter sp. WB40]MDA3968872.1 aminoacyl-tRNA hydrolase [Helicobacter ibis]
MFLIVGLGNPGNKYKNNRHNIGFMVVDFLVSFLEASLQSNKDFSGELYKKNDLLLLKPSTFMNLSGKSVLSVINFYNVSSFLVIHDDLDLKFGAVRFKVGGGSGGHNGLRSIDSMCGNEYCRIRYGIGKPELKEQVASYVLSDFTTDEIKYNESLIKHCANAALEIAKLDSFIELNKISSKYSLKEIV